MVTKGSHPVMVKTKQNNKTCAGFVKVRKSLWSLRSEQNANQPASACGTDIELFQELLGSASCIYA